MDSEERRQLYDKYVAEDRKKKILLIFPAVILIIILAVLFGQQFMHNPAGAADSVELDRAAENYPLVDASNDVCYLAQSTTDREGFLIELREYGSQSNDCSGDVLGITEIHLNASVNIEDMDCLCGERICEMKGFFKSDKVKC